MEENTYIQEILNSLGLAIDEKNNSEIIINYPIIFVKKSMKYELEKNYKITVQALGSFLVDFLNTDFSNYDDFFNFFIKYSLSLLTFEKIQKLFNDTAISTNELKNFIESIWNKNHSTLTKLQEQVDMALDYCLINPIKKALSFTPIQRLYVLKRISPDLTFLTSSKAAYYKVHLFSSYPGDSENEIYKFLGMKKNTVEELNLILPYDISSILFDSLIAVLNDKVHLKICKNCNKYFIAKNKSTDYCNNVIDGTNKTCQEIGRLKVFYKQKNNDPALALYYKVYSRKSMMKSRNPDISKYVEQFENYKTIGKKKLEKYKNGQISSEEFMKWITKYM